MPLQELDYRINQIGKEYGKHEDQDDAPGAIYDCAHDGKEQYRQQDVRGAALSEGHWWLSVSERLRSFPTPSAARFSQARKERVCNHTEFRSPARHRRRRNTHRSISPLVPTMHSQLE